MSKAVFAGGCFWHIEEAFRRLGYQTRVGYANGFIDNPTYNQVCTGTTGYAEAVELIDIKDYSKALEIFWSIHDPTTIDRQGPDKGSQYRSAIFYIDEKQHDLAIKSRDKQQEKIKTKIVTVIEELKNFYEAEDYHQKYIYKTGESCGQ